MSTGIIDIVTAFIVFTIVYLIALTTILLLIPFLLLPISTIYPDILTTASPAYTEAIVKQSWAVVAISIISACLNGVASWAYGQENGLVERLARWLNYVRAVREWGRADGEVRGDKI